LCCLRDDGFVISSVVRVLGGGFLATLFVASCGGGQSPDAAIVQIRNMTAVPVAVQITEPYSGMQSLGAPPWRPGDCSLDFGTAPGKVSIVVTGPSVQASPSYEKVVAPIPQTWITVIVGTDGAVTFGSVPVADGACQARGQVPPP
jgi:hypothetical protein